jgi:hypothetical protein
LNKAKRNLKSFGATAKRAFANLAKSALVGTTALAALSKTSIAAADNIAKSAKNAGLSADAYQRLSEVFRIGGSSAEALTKGNLKLMKGIYDLSLGLSTQVDAFEELGLTYNDLKDLSPEKQFLLVRQRLSELTNVTTKSAISQQLFGKAGKQMADILNLTNEEIDAQMDRFTWLGGVISDDLLPTSEKLTDEFTTLGKVINAQFTTALLEAISTGVNLEDLGPTIKRVGEEVHGAATAIFDFIKVIWDWKDVIGQVIMTWVALRLVMFSTAAVSAVIATANAIKIVVISIRTMNVALLLSRAIMVGTIALIVALPAAIALITVGISAAAASIKDGIGQAVGWVVFKIKGFLGGLSIGILEIEKFFIEIGAVIQEYCIDLFNDFLKVVNGALEYFNRNPIELVGQDAADEASERLREIGVEIETLTQAQKDLAKSAEDAAIALANSAQASVDAYSAGVMGAISDVSGFNPFAPPSEGPVDTSFNGLEKDPAKVALEETDEAVKTWWEKLTESWAEHGENELEPIGEQLSENLSRTLAESISEGDFKGLGDAFLSSIQETLQSQVADKLEDLFAVFFDMFFNSIGSAMNKGGAGAGGGGAGGIAGAALSSGLFFHDGGLVPGKRGADVPIVAQAGEMVLTRNQQRALLEGDVGKGDSNPITINMSSIGDVSEATKKANLQMADELADMIQTTLRERGALA